MAVECGVGGAQPLVSKIGFAEDAAGVANHTQKPGNAIGLFQLQWGIFRNATFKGARRNNHADVVAGQTLDFRLGHKD